MKKFLATIVMALAVMTVGVLFASAVDAAEYYRPYDLSVLTEKVGDEDKSFITFKYKINSAKEQEWFEYASDRSCRVDAFLIASDSPDGMEYECDYDYCISIGNGNWDSPSTTLIKDGDEWAIKMDCGDVTQVKGLDEEHPYVYLHLRPCNSWIAMDYTTYAYGVMGEAEANAYFDSCVCLGRFGSVEKMNGFKVSDFTALNETITGFEEGEYDKTEYTRESWERLQNVLKNAKNVSPTMLQEDVDKLNAELKDAIKGLAYAIIPTPGEDAPVSADIPSAQAKKKTVGDTVTATLRFVWYLFSNNEEAEITSVGAYIIPSANYSSNYMDDAVFVNIPVNSIGIGNTFGADLIDIPEAAFGDTMIAIPYVNGEAYAENLITAVVNDVDIDA